MLMPSKPIRTTEAKRKIRTYSAIGVVSLAILLITLATAGRQQALRCERLASGEVDCVVRESILGVINLNEKTIAGSQAVSIGQQCIDIDCKYRLEIYATQGLVAVNEKYTSNYSQLLEVKNLLNEFFTDETRAFTGMKEATNPILIVAVVAAVVIIWAYLGYLTWQVRHPQPEERTANQ
jgi:hypothetical protein